MSATRMVLLTCTLVDPADARCTDEPPLIGAGPWAAAGWLVDDQGR